jgi:hypothetical protein
VLKSKVEEEPDCNVKNDNYESNRHLVQLELFLHEDLHSVCFASCLHKVDILALSGAGCQCTVGAGQDTCVEHKVARNFILALLLEHEV